MKRKIICAVILTMSVLALTGCKKKSEQTVQPETQIQTEALPVAETETQEKGKYAAFILENGLMKSWHGRDRLRL